MNRFLVCIFLCFSMAFCAEAVPVSKKQSKVEITQKPFYQKALSFYKEKRYEEAYEMFNALFINHMDNMLINYYLGRSAYYTKRYEFAISAYERILIMEPSNARIHLELAQTYIQMKLFPQALAEFNTALKFKLPLKVKAKVIANIEKIKNQQKKHFFNVTMLFGVMYDSNIDNSPAAGAFDIFDPVLGDQVTLNNSGQENSTMVYQFANIFNYKYKINDQFTWDNTVTVMALKYDDYKNKDIHILSLSTKPSYFSKNYKMDLSFGFDRIISGHENFQHNFYITPSYTTTFGKKLLYTAQIKLGDINSDQDHEKDSRLLEVKNTFKYATEKAGIITAVLDLGKEVEVNAPRTDVSYDYYKLTLGNSFPLPNEYSLNTSAQYKFSHYKDMDVNFLERRMDKQKNASLEIQKLISDNILLKIGSTYTKKDSNHETFSYDKYTFNTTLLINF